MKLKELSLLLGLSTTTVSRALNGYPEVNEATRRRVEEAARRYGYYPNQFARRLATGRTLAIGIVIPVTRHELIGPVFAEFLAGAGETYSAAGYNSVLSIVPAEHELEAYRSMASQRKVDGVLVAGLRLDDPRIPLLQDLGLPFVVHGQTCDDGRESSWIDMNNRGAFRRSTELLVQMGHRRIALINGDPDLVFALRRRIGYEEALNAAGLAFDPRLVLSGDLTEPLGYEKTLAVMGSGDAPTAILTSSILTAHGALRALRELGRRPGRDVSLATHDDELAFLPNVGDTPQFTATRSSVRAAGRRAAEILIDLVTHPGAGPIQELWEADLTLGRSTGNAPPAEARERP